MAILVADHLVRRAPWQLLSLGHCFAAADEVVDVPLLRSLRLSLGILGWRRGIWPRRVLSLV
jgi:hypothetical protein